MIQLVSVIMPVFNSEEFVSKAIESVLAQTYSYFEFIIIDDGSTDTSLQIIRNYEKIDSRIRVIINKKNNGLSKSINDGIKYSEGEFIARMDADDICFVNRFSNQVNFLNSHPEIHVLGGQFEVLGSPGRVSNNSIQKELLRWHMLINLPVLAHPSVMIRRQTLNELNNYPEEFIYGQDRVLWTNFFKYFEYPISNLSETVIYYRMHNENALKRKYQSLVDYDCIQNLLLYEFNENFPPTFIHSLVDPANINNKNSYLFSKTIFSLLNKYIRKHQVDDGLIIELKKNTTKYLFDRIHKYPCNCFSIIIKSIHLYPPIFLVYLKYYYHLPEKVVKNFLFFIKHKISIKNIDNNG